MTSDEVMQLNMDIIVGLKNLALMILQADADAENISSHFRYDEVSLFDSLIVFNHVWTSVAIHKGILTEENATKSMEAFSNSIKDTFGIDTKDLCKIIIDKANETDTEKNSVEE